MDWILRNHIENMKLRIQALENMHEASTGYKLAKQDEIKWLKYELQEIEDMMSEEVRRFEEAEEDLREKRADAYI